MSKKLYYQILIYPILMLLFVTFVLISYLLYQHDENFLNISKQLHKKFELYNKESTKDKVQTILVRIKLQEKYTEDMLKSRLKEKVDTLNGILNEVYEKYKDILTKQQLKTMLIDIVEGYPFKNPDNFFFVNDLDTNKIVSHSKMPRLVGKDMTDHIDIKGLNLTLSKKEILKKQKSGFQKVYFKKPSHQDKEYPKIVYFTKFEPFNWLIGTGEYIETITCMIQDTLLKEIKAVHDISKHDLFIWKVNGDLENKDFKVLYSKDLKNHISNTPLKFVAQGIFTDEVIKNLNSKNESYVKYKINKYNEDISKDKFSYLYYFKNWNWVIGSGVFYEDIEALKLEQKKMLEDSQIEKIGNTIVVTVLATSITIAVLYILLKQVISIIVKNQQTINELNKNLKKQVDLQVKKLREQDILLVQKSKNEELGELMAMITHQWRQPLNAINSTTAKLYQDILQDNISSRKLNNHIDEIEELTSFMSKTIDDFNNFYKTSCEKVSFKPENSINKVFDIIFSKYTLIKNIDLSVVSKSEKKIFGPESAFEQVVLIIVNNAVDNFIQKNISKPALKIEIFQNNGKLNISFIDNGGGIDPKIIDNIFELYVSSKDDSSKGMGLYIARLILKTHFDATIEAYNKQNGAVFNLEFNIEKT